MADRIVSTTRERIALCRKVSAAGSLQAPVRLQLDLSDAPAQLKRNWLESQLGAHVPGLHPHPRLTR